MRPVLFDLDQTPNPTTQFSILIHYFCDQLNEKEEEENLFECFNFYN